LERIQGCEATLADVDAGVPQRCFDRGPTCLVRNQNTSATFAKYRSKKLPNGLRQGRIGIIIEANCVTVSRNVNTRRKFDQASSDRTDDRRRFRTAKP
jgi:hypothetical protein